MGMWNFVLKRLVQIVIIFVVIVVVVVALFTYSPGDPLGTLTSQARVGGKALTPEEIEFYKEYYGLDKPKYMRVITQVFSYFKGNFGRSTTDNRPVLEVISECLPKTLVLFLPATIITYLVAIPLGEMIGWKRHSKTDASITVLGLLFYCMPYFWLALLMIFLFSVKLPIFPPGGWRDTVMWTLYSPNLLVKMLDLFKHMVLPLVTLTAVSLAMAMLLMRTSMLETLKEDYIVTAKAKGLKDSVIKKKHAARNALLPIATQMPVAIAWTVSGGVVTERVFTWLGIGYTLVEAIFESNYPLAQGCFIIIAILVLMANLVADILYAYLDPRIRY
jgi:peptide/nickel transport system permease protein